MKIRLNGDLLETEAATLASLLHERGLSEAAVATAVNGVFVPASARDTSRLDGGDEVEILAPMQGG